jgi:microcystin-dependent protein
MQPLVGMIIQFAGNFAPEGWAICDGKLFSISQNQVLFSILGTTYGGDGQSTFALPNIPAVKGGGLWIIATEGIYPARP